MPDEIPVIGKSPNAEGLFHSFGYSAHGFQLAPVTGGIVANLVMHGRAGMPIEAFRPDRFNARGEAVVA